MKKAFITGTNNLKEIKNICDKLKYIEYEVIYNTITNENEYINLTERIKTLLECDVLVRSGIQNSFPRSVYEKEIDIANYLDITIFEIEDVNRLVADKLMIEIKEKEESSEEGKSNG